MEELANVVKGTAQQTHTRTKQQPASVLAPASSPRGCAFRSRGSPLKILCVPELHSVGTSANFTNSTGVNPTYLPPHLIPNRTSQQHYLHLPTPETLLTALNRINPTYLPPHLTPNRTFTAALPDTFPPPKPLLFRGCYVFRVVDSVGRGPLNTGEAARTTAHSYSQAPFFVGWPPALVRGARTPSISANFWSQLWLLVPPLWGCARHPVLIS